MSHKNWQPQQGSRLCSDHFSASDYVKSNKTGAIYLSQVSLIHEGKITEWLIYIHFYVYRNGIIFITCVLFVSIASTYRLPVLYLLVCIIVQKLRMRTIGCIDRVTASLYVINQRCMCRSNTVVHVCLYVCRKTVKSLTGLCYYTGSTFFFSDIHYFTGYNSCF